KALPVGSFARSWYNPLPTEEKGIKGLYLRSGLLFAYTRDNRSFVLDVQSGKIIRVDNPTDAQRELYPPAVSNEWVVYPLSRALRIYARNEPQGRDLNLDLNITAPITVDRNTAFVPVEESRGARIYAIDLTADA